MKTNYIFYNYEKSFERIDNILENSYTYDEVDEIPDRDKLTTTNGYYVKHCTALFVDIRDSSSLPSIHKRPTLAKLYRAYISEVVAIMNGNINCKEINVIGDGILGIFNTPLKKDIDDVISTAARISSLIDVLNYKLKKKSIEEIKIGVGISYGRLLMIKAGYKGSGIHDVVWMGEAVNEAVKLSNFGNKEYFDKETMISNVVYNNLNDKHKKLFSKNNTHYCYHGNIIRCVMNDWYKKNCK